MSNTEGITCTLQIHAQISIVDTAAASLLQHEESLSLAAQSHLGKVAGYPLTPQLRIAAWIHVLADSNVAEGTSASLSLHVGSCRLFAVYPHR